MPKDGDVRNVPLTSKAISIARRQLDGRPLARGCGIPHSDGSECRHDVLFHNTQGRPLRPVSMGNRIRNASKKADIPLRGGYSGRRGFATRAAAGGMDAFLLADVMGHSDVRVTREYVQMGQDARARTLAALGEAPSLSVVESVGQRGTDHGTNPGDHPLRSTTIQDHGNPA
ncbi:tyrosine-type recombinase/integrase [Saccharomonospora xinjiangensis]|uniref:tyrosine-type recombinase/integrase n=1 Tax=Saccharomonospora xinjiangensis TaxID=75294 RepID=UPI00350FC631